MQLPGPFSTFFKTKQTVPQTESHEVFCGFPQGKAKHFCRCSQANWTLASIGTEQGTRPKKMAAPLAQSQQHVSVSLFHLD